MSLARMAHIRRDSWHYQLVQQVDKLTREKTEITGVYQYWFTCVGGALLIASVMCVLTAVFGFIIGTLLCDAIAALIRDFWGSLGDFSFIVGTALLAAIALFLVMGVVVLASERISKRAPKVTIE